MRGAARAAATRSRESEEARHEEIPEHLEREKGLGDDGRDEPAGGEDRVAPDGESYELRRDQAAHQDRGQSSIEDAGHH